MRPANAVSGARDRGERLQRRPIEARLNVCRGYVIIKYGRISELKTDPRTALTTT